MKTIVMSEWLKKELKKAHQANLKVIADAGCRMDQSMSGYWRLLGPEPEEELLFDEPDCKDFYDKETAAYMFAEAFRNGEIVIEDQCSDEEF